jgi:purine-binding chemotaxis protein CheW
LKEERVLCFKAGKTGYAVPIQQVKEVLAPMQLTKTPGTPHYYKGLANIRGEMISVWDIRIFFQEEIYEHPENAVIILEIDGKKLGIYVDNVESVQKPSNEQLSNPPSDLFDKNTMNESILQIYKKHNDIYLVLNVLKTFFIEPERMSA